jgi:hypothetical protein
VLSGLLFADTTRLVSLPTGSGTVLVEAYDHLVHHAQDLVAQIGIPLSNVVLLCDDRRVLIAQSSRGFAVFVGSDDAQWIQRCWVGKRCLTCAP